MANKQEGGLRLVDLRKRELALKAAWVQTYHINDQIQALADYFLIPELGAKIWFNNLRSQDVVHFAKKRFLARCIGGLV